MDEIRGILVTLRILRHMYVQSYLQMFSPIVQNMLHVPSIEHERIYLNHRLVHVLTFTTLFYCIFDNVDQQLIGAIEIRDRMQFSGQLYSWLHEFYWGSGRYQEALLLASQQYFSLTQDLFFTAHVDVNNERSCGALRKGGFAHAALRAGPYGNQYVLIRRNSINFL